MTEPAGSAPDTPATTASARKPSAAREEASTSPFQVKVARVYDGPFDLLLDLIRRQNLDIYDIPIATITAQFLDYCHRLRETDVDAAGDFVYTASLLIHIKSRMLLPREPGDLPGTEEDPRRELVDRLLDHERYKAAAQMLLQRQLVEAAVVTNPGVRALGSDDEAGAIAADTVDLVRVFSDVLARLRARPVLQVDEESVTVAGMLDYTRRRLLMEDRPVPLARLLGTLESERAVICLFLALLELVRLQAVLLHQAAPMAQILIKKSDGFDALFEAGAAAQDDWR